MKTTVSLGDLIKKTETSKENRPKPLSKNAVKGATDFIRKNNIEKKTSSKLVEKYEQSGSKVVAKQVAKYEQSGSKVVAKQVAKYEQSGSTKQRSGSKVVAQPVAEQVAKYEQSGSKVVAKSSFQELTGIQKKITEIVYNSCRRNGEKISSPITIEYLSNILETSSGTVKNAILRLQKKNILTKEISKNGRGGWTQYKLHNETYQDLLQYESDSKVVAKYEQSGSKVVAQPVAKQVARLPSSSSSDLLIKKLIKKNTTTTTPLDEGLGIDIPDNLKEIGFGASQISHVFNNAKNPLTPQELQDSLDAFSYDLKQELIKPKTSPLNFLMGVLLKRGAYTSEAILIESKKEIESYMKTIKELEISMEDLKSVNKQKQFEKWLETIPDDERNKIVPPSPLIKTGSRYQLVMLKDYWEKEINSNNS